MNRLFLFLLFIPFSSLSQGLITISKEEYNKIPSVKFDNTLGFFESKVPDSYSLEKYVPNVISQGNSNACTGFSVFYYGLSTQYNSTLKITNPTDKTGHSFDPFYAYSIINDNTSSNNYECDASNKMRSVLDILQSRGAKKRFFEPHMKCYSSSDILDNNINKHTLPYSIENYYKIPSLGTDKAVEYAKNLIYNNKPVMLGLITTKSLRDVKKDGNYSPTSLELDHIYENLVKIGADLISKEEKQIFIKEHMPHALTIIGYNDNKFGGAFRIVNSWGKDWGDNGYFWLKYKDFKNLTTGAYALSLSSNIDSNENPQFDFDGYKRLIFDNGSSYEGLVSEELPNGQGIWSFYDEKVGQINAIGTWKDGEKNGFFTIIHSEDEIFIGNYKDDIYIENNSFGFTGDDDKDSEDLKKKEQRYLEYMRQFGVNAASKIRRSKTIIIKTYNKT